MPWSDARMGWLSPEPSLADLKPSVSDATIERDAAMNVFCGMDCIRHSLLRLLESWSSALGRGDDRAQHQYRLWAPFGGIPEIMNMRCMKRDKDDEVM